MAGDGHGTAFLARALAALPAEEAALLGHLHRFTRERLQAAADAAQAMEAALDSGSAVAALLHGFLRECWGALDGLAREANVCMNHLSPEAGLPPPMQVTRQCTMYVVRKALRDSPVTAGHPVSALLWERTRADLKPAYERLSFLHNLGLFVSIPLCEGSELPGMDDVPPVVRGLVRTTQVGRCPMAEGVREMLEWTERFAADVYAALAKALAGC